MIIGAGGIGVPFYPKTRHLLDIKRCDKVADHELISQPSRLSCTWTRRTP